MKDFSFLLFLVNYLSSFAVCGGSWTIFLFALPFFSQGKCPSWEKLLSLPPSWESVGLSPGWENWTDIFSQQLVDCPCTVTLCNVAICNNVALCNKSHFVITSQLKNVALCNTCHTRARDSELELVVRVRGPSSSSTTSSSSSSSPEFKFESRVRVCHVITGIITSRHSSLLNEQ